MSQVHRALTIYFNKAIGSFSTQLSNQSPPSPVVGIEETTNHRRERIQWAQCRLSHLGRLSCRTWECVCDVSVLTLGLNMGLTGDRGKTRQG